MNAVDEQGRLVPKAEKTSSFYGVCWHKGRKTWQAHVRIESKNKYLGKFHDETAAARAVDAYLYEHYPAVAAQKANFPRA